MPVKIFRKKLISVLGSKEFVDKRKYTVLEPGILTLSETFEKKD
jgi:hypothetical protein